MSSSDSVSSVKQQYENWPYPQIPLWARLHRDHLWQLNLDWMFRRLGRQPIQNPKIWIAGCGTFQPYAFSRANPQASILATDLSEASLKRAQKRCRLQGISNVCFSALDLNQLETYPDEKFDFIECYGVLMSLPDPGKVLRALSERLHPHGILRVMVYTHYGRQRVFQIQKLAKLLGLGPIQTDHPQRLIRLMQTLPSGHPLKATFFEYPDSKNLPGIVDGFLHASDRGFTGKELAHLLDEAGLNWGFCFHRPWGDPKVMEEKLQLKGLDPAFWLHYLDLWQSLKSNFILCAVPKAFRSAPQSLSQGQKHALFDLSNRVELRHKARLLRLAFLGGRLQTRTHEQPLKLSSGEVRSLLRGKNTSANVADILNPEASIPEPFFQTDFQGYPPTHPWKVALGKAPNPMYRHLFDAYHPLGGLSLDEQMERWRPHFRPLEDDGIPWGLTPGETYLQKKAEIKDWLNAKSMPEYSISEVQLIDEKRKIEDLGAFLRRVGGLTLPESRTSRRILWILLLSHSELFLEFQLSN